MNKKDKGLGDTLARFTKATGIKEHQEVRTLKALMLKERKEY